MAGEMEDGRQGEWSQQQLNIILAQEQWDARQEQQQYDRWQQDCQQQQRQKQYQQQQQEPQPQYQPQQSQQYQQQQQEPQPQYQPQQPQYQQQQQQQEQQPQHQQLQQQQQQEQQPQYSSQLQQQQQQYPAPNGPSHFPFPASHLLTAQYWMPMSGLHGQCSMIDGGVETWVADNGASQHMTFNPDYLYNRRTPSPENAQVYIGDGTMLQVEFVGSVNLTFHSSGQDVRVTLESVFFLPS